MSYNYQRSPLAVKRQAVEALNLARLAARAYQMGLRGRGGLALFHAAAERSYQLILATVCELTDEQADLIEPIVTALELVLYGLAGEEIADQPSYCWRSWLN